MVYDDLKRDVMLALQAYIKRFDSFETIPIERQQDIATVHNILKLYDPVLICQRLRELIVAVRLPLISWITCIDANRFAKYLKLVIITPKYQELNLLRQMIKEKESIIAEYKRNQAFCAPRENQCSSEVKTDLQLLNRENSYLYGVIAAMELKVGELQNEKVMDQARVMKAEQELLELKRRYNNLVKFNATIKNIVPQNNDQTKRYFFQSKRYPDIPAPLRHSIG